MKTTLVLALSFAALLAPPAGATDSVTVTLDVTLSSLDYASCDVAVPAGADGGDVLDAAVEAGCIGSWRAAEYPGFGRYVECIDEVCGAVATYWAMLSDGEYAEVGIDAWRATHGATLSFDYRQWLL